TIIGYTLLAVLSPLRSALGWAAVLAFLLHPLHQRLTRRLKNRAGLSAGTLTVLTPFFVLAPLAVLGAAFAGQVASLIAYLRGRTLLSYPQLMERLQGYPVVGSLVGWVRENASISAEQVQSWITESAQSVLKSAAKMGGDVALGIFGTLVGFFMML